MAEHIARHSEAIKFLGYQKEQLLKSQRILSSHHVEDWRGTEASFTLFREHIRSLLGNFLKERRQNSKLAMEHGYNEDRLRLLLSLIKASSRWQKNLEQEATSMLQLAKTIGDNILNLKDGIKLRKEYKELLLQKMSDFFYIELTLSFSLYEEYKQNFRHFAANSPQIMLFTISKHDKEPEFRVKIGEEIFNLSLSGLDFKQLFLKIITFFKKSMA